MLALSLVNPSSLNTDESVTKSSQKFIYIMLNLGHPLKDIGLMCLDQRISRAIPKTIIRFSKHIIQRYSKFFLTKKWFFLNLCRKNKLPFLFSNCWSRNRKAWSYSKLGFCTLFPQYWVQHFLPHNKHRLAIWMKGVNDNRNSIKFFIYLYFDLFLIPIFIIISCPWCTYIYIYMSNCHTYRYINVKYHIWLWKMP